MQFREIARGWRPTLRCQLPATLAITLCVSCITDTDSLKKKRPPEEEAPVPGFDFGSDAGPESDPLFPGSPDPGEPPRTTLPKEPEGDRSLTLLHGVTDARHVHFCLIAGEADEQELYPFALPRGGLAFGESFVLSEESAFDIGDRALSVFLVASRSPLKSGARCKSLLVENGFDAPPLMKLPEASPFPFGEWRLDQESKSDLSDVDSGAPSPEDAGAKDAGGADSSVSDAGSTTPDSGSEPPAPPELRVVSLVQAPAGTFGKEYSTLLVPSGCIGARAFSDPGEQSLCGPGYSSRRTTLTPVFSQLSRVLEFGSVGLQLLNASPAFPRATVRSNPKPNDGALFTIASDVSFGEIAPPRARTGVAVDRLGTPVAETALEVLPEFGSEVLSSQSWGSALERAGISELENSRAYTFVLIGPAPSIQSADWWNGSTLALVKNSPLAE